MIEGGKTYLIVKSLITGSVRGQTIKYIEDNVLGKEPVISQRHRGFSSSNRNLQKILLVN